MFENQSYFFILTNWFGGGIERIFTNVVKGLVVWNHSPKIYLYVINGFDSKKYSINENIKTLKNLVELFYFVNTTKSKTIINFSCDWKSSIISRCLSRNYISWIHNNPYTMRRARTSCLNFYLLKKSNKIVCVCNEQKEILQNEFFFVNEFVVIYNSVDFEYVRKQSILSLEINYNYLLMVARVDLESKDFFTLIDAYSQLDKLITNTYKLVLLGDGPDFDKVNNYILRKKMQKNIILQGYDSNPYKWLKNSVCNILSSKTEGFNVTVIEGMILECPQIITKYQTGSAEVSNFGQNTLLVNIGDVIGLKNAIESLINDSLLRKKIVSNANDFVLNFSQEIFQDQIKKLFHLE